MDIFRSQRIKKNWIVYISFVVVMALGSTFIMTLSNAKMTQNVENRVFKELKSISVTQASAMKHYIEDQYKQLELISNMLDNGEIFASEEMKPTLRAMVENYSLDILGYVDLEGNVTDYEGKQRSNINARTYFSNIVNGEVENHCEYVAVTNKSNEPRVIFSIPTYSNGQIAGVLFNNENVTVLENSLFERELLVNEDAIIFVCDSKGKMIVANETAHEKCLASGADDRNCCIFEQLPDIEKMYHAGLEKAHISMYGTNAYASLVPVGINDWMVGCILETQTAKNVYAANLKNIQEILNSVTVYFILTIGYIILLSFIIFRQEKKKTQQVTSSYENYATLFKEMKCTVLEYNPKIGTFISCTNEEDPYEINGLDGKVSSYMDYKERHSEFDFEELERGVKFVKDKRNTYSFESIFIVNKSKTCWVKTVLIPIVDRNNNFKIFCVILDVTDMHTDFDDAAETFMKIPGGIHRCYLSSPIHLEYFSEGLCKMLGYTHKEVETLVTPECKYSLLIHPEDRPVFGAFVRRLAANFGTETCEYRMICKDGSLITVSDTMEAVKSSSGIIYGYSIVTDLGSYKEQQEQLKKELEKTRQALEIARIKNSNSQMQPHFLYNALASIREIVLDDPMYASDLIYDFTTHLRACIRSMASDNLVTFEQELENIKAYVNIEKMRFGDRMDIQYDCPETSFNIIPLTIQPMVENAIRHGIYERGSDGGRVKVSSYRKEDGFVIQVEDDGIGFDFEGTMNEVKSGKKDSTGLFNLIFRLENLMKAQVIVDSQIGIGTKITVIIPIGGEK